MSTKRMIHDRFFDSLDTAEWTIRQRYLVLGMIAHADDQGRLLADPRVLKKDIVPYDAVTPADIQDDIEHVAEHGDTIILYEVDERQYVQFANWWEYQRLQWAKPSEYPAPDEWQDRIRQLQYEPTRWVKTVNWPGTDDCTSHEPDGEGAPTPGPKANGQVDYKGNEGGDGLPNRLPDASGNFNTNTPSNANPKVSGDRGSGKGGALTPLVKLGAIPPPESEAEQDVLGHPAIEAYVLITERWPGYDVTARLIMERVGENPNTKALTKAWQLWVASGNKRRNAVGVLDWYDNICADPDWSPGDRFNASPNGRGRQDEPELQVDEDGTW